MNNLNQKILATFSHSPKKKMINNTPMTNLIYSIVPTDLNYDINYASFVKRLKLLKCKKAFIFNIIPYGKPSVSLLNDTHVSYLPITYENPYYFLETIPMKDFFKENYIESILLGKVEKFNGEPMIRNSLFIFNTIPLPFLIATFKLNKIILTSGSNTRRGLLSPVHLKMGQFITCIEGMDRNTVFDKYSNYLNLATQPIFDHSVIETASGITDIGNFFIILEQYFKIKLGVDQNAKIFDWDLRKERNIEDRILNFEEFMKFYHETIKKQ